MRWILLAALILAALMLVMLPLRIAFAWSGLADRGVSARSIDGTVWNGRIEDMRIGRLELGNLDARLAPLPLLSGEIALALSRPAEEAPLAPLSFVLRRSSRGVAIDDANGEIDGRPLFGALPVRTLGLDEVHVKMVDGRCTGASGTMRVALEQNLFGFILRHGLIGQLRCDGTDLLIPLRGQTGLERLDIRIAGDGRYSAEFSLEGLSQAVRLSLAAIGFTRTGEAMRMRVEGRLQN